MVDADADGVANADDGELVETWCLGLLGSYYLTAL